MSQVESIPAVNVLGAIGSAAGENHIRQYKIFLEKRRKYFLQIEGLNI